MHLLKCQNGRGSGCFAFCSFLSSFSSFSFTFFVFRDVLFWMVVLLDYFALLGKAFMGSSIVDWPLLRLPLIEFCAGLHVCMIFKRRQA